MRTAVSTDGPVCRAARERNLRAPVGVCLWPEPEAGRTRTQADGAYLREIFDHAGLCRRDIDPGRLARALPGLGVLVSVGNPTLAAPEVARLRRWLEEGGAWLSIAGTCGAEELFGVTPAPVPGGMFGAPAAGAPLGEGYLRVRRGDHPALQGVGDPLHYVNGVAVRRTRAAVLATALDAHQRALALCAVTEHTVGRGRTLLIAPDAVGTVVRIQQGVPVVRDGIPPSDGSASVADGILKSDDGIALDWAFDRRAVPGAGGLKAFLDPAADRWREVILRSVFHLAARQGVALPLLWYYPRNRPAIAHLSHDSDGNEEGAARALLDELAALDVRSTWCLLAPGYGAAFHRELRDAGHETALHFDARSPGTRWARAEMMRQCRRIERTVGRGALVTNKNHYLRWEGGTAFFRWCASLGIAMDQSKGPSKTGAAGFPFGTGHPFFPVDAQGRRIDVLELPTQTQDLGFFAPAALGDALIDAARQHHGVLHLLFHPAHMHRAPVVKALRRAVRRARARGLEWWTAAELNRWERARRQARWTQFVQRSGRVRVQLCAGHDLPGAAVLLLLPPAARLRADGQAAPGKTVERWGFRWRVVEANLAAGRRLPIEAAW